VSPSRLLFEMVSDPVHPVFQYHTRQGYFPWSTNQGKKGEIHSGSFSLPFSFDIPQGDRLKINVIDQLQDSSLDLATSIVRSLFFGMHLES
jgi:hypothetical protein